MILPRRRLLVTGAGGMVGSYVPEAFAGDDLLLTDVIEGMTPLDVCEAGAVRDAVERFRPNVVLHLAAATDVDRCEQEPAWAHRLNAEGTRHVAEACQRVGATVVYLSTGAVFPGTKATPYHEEDRTEPANVYGRSKLEGEQWVSRLVDRHYIVRAGWMIGGGARDKKFVGKIVRLIAGGRRSLEVVNDAWGSPTYAKDLLHKLRRLLELKRYGLYHMVNSGHCSRYDIAAAILDALQRADVSLIPVSSAAFPLPAPRPRMEALQNRRLEQLGLQWMRPWQEALRAYLQEELLVIPLTQTVG